MSDESKRDRVPMAPPEFQERKIPSPAPSKRPKPRDDMDSIPEAIDDEPTPPPVHRQPAKKEQAADWKLAITLGAVAFVACVAIALPVVIVLLVSGQSKPSPSPRPAQEVETIEFGGKEWVASGEKGVDSTILGGAAGEVFVSGKPSERLLVIDGSTTMFKELVEMKVMQANLEGKWVRHGLTEEVRKDRDVEQSPYRYGELHGIFRAFYPNGKPKVSRTFVGDQANGPAVAFHEDGTLQWAVYCVADKEVAGEAWEPGEMTWQDFINSEDGHLFKKLD